MIHEPDLLAAVIAQPEDDAPRLACARWLRERGEYIEIECTLAKLPDDDPARFELARQSSVLFDVHREAGRAGFQGAGIEFRRGFVWSLWTSLEDHLLAFLDRAPIERMELACERDVRDPASIARGIAADPRVGRLRQLGFDVGSSDEAFAAFIAGPHWQRLRTLELCDADNAPSAAHAVASASLPDLETLELGGVAERRARSCSGAAAIFSNAPNLAGLRRLALNDIALGPEAARQIAVSPFLTRLQGLELRPRFWHAAERICAGGAMSLAGSRNFAALEQLARIIHHDVERDQAARGRSGRTPGSAARIVLDVLDEREPAVRHEMPAPRRSQPAAW